MTSEERRAQLRAILDKHNEAARRLRDTSGAFKSAAMHLTHLYANIEDAAAHIRVVSDGILEANTAALALFNDEP